MLLLNADAIQAQQTYCGSYFYPPTVQNVDSARYNRYLQVEQFIRHYLDTVSQSGSSESTARLSNPNSTIIIPVVVHVLHNGEPIGVGINISNAQIQSQIDVLNEDFRRLNADRVNTPAVFTPVAADPNIEFRLACVNPNGNATNGIDRVQTNIISFQYHQNNDGSTNEFATGIKFTSQGGVDAWPTDRYLNIWVCNIAPDPGGQLLGYSQFPFDYAASPNTDGVVIFNRAFGRVDGNFLQGYAEGRTTTHEVGHWLDLFHIWGDDQNAPNVCSGSDSCADTPNQGVQNQSDCPGFPHLSCNNGPNGDMFMNYMDYTLDACKNIYTQDQTNRMRAIFATGGPRFSFINNYFHVNPQSTAICTTAQVSATNLSCLPITWSIISGPAVIQSGQGSNTITLQKTGDGAAVVSATAGGYTDQVTIAVGKVQPGPITFYLIDPTLGKLQAGVDPVPGATSYNWYKNGVLQTGHGSFIQMPITRNRCNIEYDIAVEAINNCGTSSQTHANAYVPPCNNAFTISPNPASNSINITPAITTSQLSANNPSNTIDAVRIYDLKGMLKKYQKFNKATSASINVQGLANGSYLIQITCGTYEEKQQLVIQK